QPELHPRRHAGDDQHRSEQHPEDLLGGDRAAAAAVGDLLGMINIDQNNILKIFSVVTVLLLPPSVIGALFGMNFKYIPALQHPWGFWGALIVMVLSSALPFLWFRRRGWL